MMQSEASRKQKERGLELCKGIGLIAAAVAIIGGAWFAFARWTPFSGNEGEMSGERNLSSPSCVRALSTGNEVREEITRNPEQDMSHGRLETRKSVFEECKRNIVVIGTEGNGGGMAFLLKMGGGTYLVTTEHTARYRDFSKNIYLFDGTSIGLGNFEVAENRGLARFKVQDNLPALEMCQNAPSIKDRIWVYGNIAGRGTLAECSGEIKSIGADKIEVEAKIVAGNGGSPVLNAEGEVLGVYAFDSQSFYDGWAGTLEPRHNKGKGRMCVLRFTGVKWSKKDWSEYTKSALQLQEVEEFCSRIKPFIAVVKDGDAKLTHGELHYNELTRKMFEENEAVFRPVLIEMSSEYGQWNRTVAEFQAALKQSGDAKRVDESRKKWKAATHKFVLAIVKSLTMVGGALDMKWPTSLMQGDATFFCNWATSNVAAMEQEVKSRGVSLERAEKVAAETSQPEAPTKTSDKRSLFDKCMPNTVLIRAGASLGTGFLMKQEGRTRLITNDHVARGGNPFFAKTCDGKVLKLEPTIEVATDRDLVRMTVVGEYPALELATYTPKGGQAIHVFGNSDGGDVATHLDGRINGVGPDLVEVDCGFVQGNSGSAIIDDDGKVLAVATYLENRNEPENWVKKGTRFNGVRRYGVRLCNVEWETVTWQNYSTCSEFLNELDWYFDFFVKLSNPRENGNRILTHEANILMKGSSVGELQGFKVRNHLLKQAIINIAKQDDAITQMERKSAKLLHDLENVHVTTKTKRRTDYEEGRNFWGKYLVKTKYNEKVREGSGSMEAGLAKDQLARIYRNYPQALKKCLEARRKALKTAETLLRTTKLPYPKRLTAVPAEHVGLPSNVTKAMLIEIFKHLLDTFEVRFKEDLIAPRKLPTPEILQGIQ